METEDVMSNTDAVYPVLLMPKARTLAINYDDFENILIDLTITTRDREGNVACIYSGLCYFKFKSSCDIVLEHVLNASNEINNDQNMVLDTGTTYPPYSQSKVWIDPARSPYVYNSCNTVDAQEQHSVYHHQSQSSHITVEQHNTYVTQNVYNTNCYSPVDEFEHKKFKKIQNESSNQNSLADEISYEDDEFWGGMLLSKLPEETTNENETQAVEEMNCVGIQSENDALKQLMSSDVQSLSKPQKTIQFLCHKSEFGQTIQKIAINDPHLKCAYPGQSDIDHEFVIDQSKRNEESRPNQKKYQCDKCKQIFDQIAEFKQHMIGNHKRPNDDDKFMCSKCGKNLKNQEKFEMHLLGHGNPELECNKCHKVFASKFTLRTHKKIHKRMEPSDNLNLLTEHKNTHTEVLREPSDNDFNVSIADDLEMTLSPIPEDSEREIIEHDEIGLDTNDIAKADSIIAKVVSNKMFHQHSKKTIRGKKTCDVCLKSFNRTSDLKRHLIEHVIHSTLAKNPVNSHGTLNILCEVCQVETFTKIDKYKAHLREHAKLTIYKCTFCDKSFSDSSNFSKHKKVHGITYFQCDICQRKFNSKKMISQHMEYHIKNAPIPCYYCNKVFYFESMLNKHIKAAHTREITRFRCTFCHKYLRSVRNKWDHERNVHNLRKKVVDCILCHEKYRKYVELKRHYSSVHDMEVPKRAKDSFIKRKA